MAEALPGEERDLEDTIVTDTGKIIFTVLVSDVLLFCAIQVKFLLFFSLKPFPHLFLAFIFRQVIFFIHL